MSHLLQVQPNTGLEFFLRRAELEEYQLFSEVSLRLYTTSDGLLSMESRSKRKCEN